MLKDQIDLLSVFNEHGVEYLIQRKDQFFQVGVEPHRVDILQSIPGVRFEEAWLFATDGTVEGLPVRFISREHLLLNKLAAGRPRDLEDVDELRRFAPKS